jgi:hypothetical protein
VPGDWVISIYLYVLGAGGLKERCVAALECALSQREKRVPDQMLDDGAELRIGIGSRDALSKAFGSVHSLNSARFITQVGHI